VNNKKIKSPNNRLYLIYFVFFFVTILPLLIFKYPILVDYPNHLATFYIQAHIDNDLWIKENYMVEWTINPYFILEALGGVLARYIDVFIVGKIIIILGFFFIASGVILIRRNITGHIDTWAATAFVFFYNYILFYGFLNYYVGSGIALIAMGMWIKYRQIKMLNHLLLFSIISAFLFFTHLFALGLYGVFVVSYELGIYKYSRDRFSLSSCVKAGCQFLLPVILFFIWSAGIRKYDVGSIYDYGDAPDKIIALLSPISFDFSESSIFITLFMLVSILTIRVFYPKGVGIYENMKMPIWCFFILVIITPRSLSGIWAVDSRIPFVFILLLIASIKFDENEKDTVFLRKYIVWIAIITLCLKIYFISDTWSRVGPQYEEFENSLQYISQGSKVITVQEESKELKNFDAILYHHMCALSVIKRSVFWPKIFTELTPIRPSAKTAPIDSPSSMQLTISDLRNNKLKNGYVYGKGDVVYWENWTQDFDYLISIRFENMSVIDIKNLKLKFRGSFFDIYQIVH
jgi:hypothetical protein